MTANELRNKYLDFFRSKQHSIIPSASLIPENDPTVLFITAGMQPLVPYLLGQAHPMGRRLADAQKCVRTGDIDEVGDNTHLTFFEMLGNWSLGDYFKVDSLQWSYEFLTEGKWLAIDPHRIYVTAFAGDEDAPRDEECIKTWQNLFSGNGIEATVGIPGQDEPPRSSSGYRIYIYPKSKNWWGPAGQTGPCGTDSEIFYDTGKDHDPSYGSKCHPNCDCGRFVEIWNNVFMQYNKNADGLFTELEQKNIDTGMGLERVTAILQGKSSVFDTEIFRSVFAVLEKLSGKLYGQDGGADRSMRIIADHLRAATFIIGDERGIAPSNVGQGYIVRRLIRRSIREGKKLGIEQAFVRSVSEKIIDDFGDVYGELRKNADKIFEELENEETKFGRTIDKGLRELRRILDRGEEVTGEKAFMLFSTYGFPLELTEEILSEDGVVVDRQVFTDEFARHQDLSRSSAGSFKGGLADHSDETTRLHTATHLLHQALRNVLGDHVEQRGSNITPERLRFDFNNPEKVSPEDLVRVEDIVNEQIRKSLPVACDTMTVDEAKAAGAIGLFGDKYDEVGGKVMVYTVGDDKSGVFSREICGGPHVVNTSELGEFKIKKEESVSSGVRRIKATVTGPLAG